MFIAKNEDLIILVNEDKDILEEQLTSSGMFYTSIEETETEYILYNGEYLTQDEIDVKERERLDALTLTPADVERALYKAKNMDFDDLKVLIAEQMTGIDVKALAIEFRAKDFYRGAKYGHNKLFDVVGNFLGYTPSDMDYLFEHKELPDKNEIQ